MNETPDQQSNDTGKVSWIAIGFIGAFSLSVFTVISTGLKVRDHGAAFDGGFRSITMEIGEVRTVDLVFESQEELDDVMLEVTMPHMLEFADQPDGQGASRPVSLDIGSNRFSIDVKATHAGKDYLRTFVARDVTIDVYRIFVTVDEDAVEDGVAEN
jgi:hypothetical protein